ncbi:MAG: MFS family permease [Granulosicoccus sp.]|jgi:MFS family permease
MSEGATTKEDSSRPFSGYGLAGYSFFILFLASSFFLHSRGIFFPYWMEEFDVSRTEISSVITFTLFIGSCISPFMGYVIDRYPVKYVVVFGAFWLALGYFLLQHVDSYWAFFAVLVVFQGIGWVCVGPLVHSKLMVNWFVRNRGLALGIAIMGISVAGIVVPTITTYLASTVGWRTTYLLYVAVLIVVVVPLSLIVIKQKPSDVGQAPDGDELQPILLQAPPSQTGRQVYSEFLRSKSFWSIVLTFTLMGGVYSAMITHLPSYLTTELDFDLYDAAYVLSVAGVFAIIGKILFGWMMDNFPSRITVMIGITSYFASTIVFMSTQSYILIMVAAGLFGLGFGGMEPVRSVLLSRLFGSEKFSRVSGLFTLFLAPATFWVLATGYITDTFGSYVYAFQIWAVGFFLAGAVTMLTRLPNKEDGVI